MKVGEPGVRSQSPWKELNGPGGKMRSSTACSVPSGRGREVMATLVLALTSASEALTTPRILALSLSVSLSSPPSRDLTVTTLPSTFSIVPRTRTFCACAETEVSAKAVATAAAARTRVEMLPIAFLPDCRAHRSPARVRTRWLLKPQPAHKAVRPYIGGTTESRPK